MALRYVTEIGTGGIQAWIAQNLVPLMVFVTAVVLFALANKGNNAMSMRVVAGVIIALAVLGLATGNNASRAGQELWDMVSK